MAFYIEMVQAGKGDSYIINIEKNDIEKIRILVDGASERKENKINLYSNLKNMIKKGEKINGIIVTHIDDDHIGGILNLLNDNEMSKYLIEDESKFFIIFNDFCDESLISYKQGIRLKEIIEKHENITLINTYKENKSIEINNFNIIFRMKDGPEVLDRDNNIIINFLLPKKCTLKKLMKAWKCEKKGSTIINRSSIVFTLKYSGKTILMSGDGYFKDIIKILEDEDGFTSFDLIKIAHHGSRNNNLDLQNIVKKYKCKKLMLLTNLEHKILDEKLINELKEIENLKIYCPYNIEFLECDNNEKIELD